MAVGPGLARLRPYVPAAAVAAIAGVLAWAFAVTVLRHTRPMGLPLDDSYIYLTYAKQLGRGQPFSYFPGGGYSAGATSVVWPMLLAPFWALGARGHALVWVSFVMCAALYAATCAGVFTIARRFAGPVAGGAAAVMVLGIAPFAFTSLSGMEVALASALLVALVLLLLEQPARGRPTKRLLAVLAALSLSRPEATLLVVAVVGVAVVQRLRAGERSAVAWWLAALAPPALWLLANRLLAGNWLPNTGVAKSHFYLPGFDWTYWFGAVWKLSGQLLEGLFWGSGSPLVWPRLAALLWVIGAVRLARRAHREHRLLAGVIVLVSPFALMFAVIASSGLWNIQNYRYIAPAFPLLAIPIGCAVAPLAQVVRERTARLAWTAAVAALGAGFAYRAVPQLVEDARLFAQGAVDTNTQVVTIGRYIHDKLPGAVVMFHDAGAIAYYGDGPVYDMLGLVTNHQAGVANNGPGARFEMLESLPPEQRPTHFAYYPSWMGTYDWFGDLLLRTPLLRGISRRRLAGDIDMEVIVANWDHVGTAERPLDPHPGWTIVDRLDIADLASERAHAWRGALGRRELGDPTARWSYVAREVGPHGLLLDGGRTIRGRREDMTLALDPARPTLLLLRTGGAATYLFQDSIRAPVTLRVLDDADHEVARATLPVPRDTLVDIAFELPAGTRGTLHTDASGPYRALHWFALQPE